MDVSVPYEWDLGAWLAGWGRAEGLGGAVSKEVSKQE